MSSRMPGYMARQTVTVTPYVGSSAYEDIYDDPYPLRCRIEPHNRLVRSQQGEETVASAKMYCFPEATIGILDKVSWNGVEYDIISVMPEPGMNGRIHHIEVTLA